MLPGVTGDAARTVVGTDANDATFTDSSLQVQVLRTGTAVSLGCDPNEYTAQGVTGKVVVVQRGVCARVARAIYGQKAGAAAVVMVNTDGSTPPFEDQITVNPDTGEQYTVTIPFIGVPGPVTSPSSPGSRLIARDGQTIQVNNGTPIRTGTASFSSDGPRLGDAALKPDIAAPGEAINSTLVGSGTGSVIESGTSMATPHIAGVAALGIQAHRNWKPAAIINSGNPDQLADYATHRVGTGLVNAASVAGTLAYAYGDADEIALNFGLKEFKADYNATKTIHIKNDANTAITFNVSVDHQNGSPHTLTPNSTAITVSAHGTGTVAVSLNVPAATAGNSDDFRSVAGTVTFTPASANDNRGISLKVPYFLVPRVSSNVAAKLPKFNGLSFSTASVTNASANITGTADFYAWGLESPDVGLGRIDLRAAGVQSFDSGTGDRVVVFAVNTFAGWSTNELEEFDISVDVDGDGNADYVVFNEDFGLLQGLARTGQVVAAIANLHTGGLAVDYAVTAPTDSSTILLPVLASHLGLTAANPRLSYTVTSFDLLSTDLDSFDDTAGFNVFTSSISTGLYYPVTPNQTFQAPIQINPLEYALTPMKGLMIVSQDNKNGASEALLLTAKF